MTGSLLTEIENRWQSMFTQLAAGADVPPAARLRTEGMMEAAVILQQLDEVQLLAVMDRCYETAFGATIAVDFGEDWRDFYPFPQIPAMGRRAPVYPSTRD